MDRRTLLKAGVAVPAAAALPLGGALTAAAEARPRLGKVLARGLDIPWGLAFLPSGDALVSERDSGIVYRVDKRGGRRAVDEVPGVYAYGEGGLLGLELDPHFRRNRWVYAYLTTGSDNRVVRMRYVDGRLRRPRVLLAGIPMNSFHNGGRLRFGGGGLLYVATGDAGDRERAQQRGSLAGKILRIQPDGDVPRGNPGRGNPVFTWGHRNVQGLAFDGHGELWASELGEKTRDELNKIVKGDNYGWPRVEGGDGRGGRYHDPFVTWSPTAVCSPSGITIARNRAWVAALNGESLYSVVLRGPRRRRVRRHFHGTVGRIRTVERAPDGSLWIATANGGDDQVIRITL